MERLTYKTGWGKAYLENGADAVWKRQVAYDVLDKAVQKLAKYEDLEEQGLLLKLPCKVGTQVYCIWEVYDFGTDEMFYHICEQEFTTEMTDDFGKTVFLTKAEAEKALAEMEK